MHGLNKPSLLTKKKPAPAREEDGWIIPALSKEVMYSSMATLSGPEME